MGCNLFPDSLSVPVTAVDKRLTDCLPFWLRHISIFGLFQINGDCGCSLELFIAPSLARYSEEVSECHPPLSL